MYNPNSLDTICGALAYALGIEAPSEAAPANADLTAYIDTVFGGEKADRVIMYNPDAIAEWIFRKYPSLTKGAQARTDIEIPLCSVMPSVTPVCFGTMYTGAQPAVHGIRKYEKPVIKIDSIFDAAIRAGLRAYIPETTKLIIAQRVSSVMEADLIILLENGRIAARGTHAELLASSEHYRELCEQQMGGAADEE